MGTPRTVRELARRVGALAAVAVVAAAVVVGYVLAVAALLVASGVWR